MFLNRLKKNPEKKKKIAHILAGMTILIHAYERYESGHSSWIFFACAGVVFLLVAALHGRIEQKAPWVDGVFFVIEASLSFMIAYEYFHAGKKGLPFCYLLAGIAQLFVAFLKSKKGIAHHKENRHIS